MPAQRDGHAAVGDGRHAVHGQVSAVALQHQARTCAVQNQLRSTYALSHAF